MIPDFKTYIRESVWGDLHSRGIGELEREEDDVNLLDRQEMIEYIKKHYNINDNNYHPHVTGNVLCVPIIMWKNVDGMEVNCLFYDYVDNVVYVTKKIHKGTYKKIKSNPLYSTAIYCKGFYSIDPKNGEVNNRFFLEVIDFILHIITKGVLPMLSKKNVNESVWADLHSRGIGELEREEDDINLMDSRAFYDYLQKNYKDKVYYISQENFTAVHHIYIDVTMEIYVHIVYRTPEGGLQNIEHIFIGEPHTIQSEKIVSSLYRQFDVAPPRGLSRSREIAKKDDSELTNQTFLDIVDILLKKIKSNQKKPIKESVWADLHSRGIGEIEREEDDINFMSSEDLVEYIKDNYDLNGGSFRLGENIHIPVFKYDNGKESFLSYTHLRRTLFFGESFLFLDFKYFNTIKKKFTLLLDTLEKKYDIQKIKQHSKDWTDLKISPKEGGKITNSFFMDVLDTVIENIEKMPDQNKFIYPLIRKKSINESVWGDLHSRGIGETEREEDKFFDLESLKEYIDNKIKTTTGDTLDLRNLDLSNLDSLKYKNIIFDLIGYKQIKIIDVTGWKTSTIKNMSGVFDWCRNVEKIKGLETWDVSNVKDMSYMFSCCSSLTDINIERWKVDKVMNMKYMFYKCKSLKKLNLEHWNIDATTDYMFYECGVVQISDLPGINNNIIKKYMKKLSNIKESVWGDLHSRGIGETEREEDSVNNLEFDEFFVYLKDRYEKINGSGAQIGHFRSFFDLSILNIVLSIEKRENIYIKYDENKHQILYLEISNALLSYPKIKQKLEQNYKHYMNDSVVKKSGKITNQDCVNLIDYFLDVVDKPVLKKKS